MVEGRFGDGEGGDAWIDGGVALEEHAADEVATVSSSGETSAISDRLSVLRGQPVMTRHRKRVAELHHALIVAGQRERATLVVADVDAGEAFEGGVEVAAVGGQFGLHVAAARARHQARRVPARPARDPVPLEDDRVTPAALRKVERDGRADDAAADHDRSRARGRVVGGARVEGGRGARGFAKTLSEVAIVTLLATVSRPSYYPRASA